MTIGQLFKVLHLQNIDNFEIDEVVYPIGVIREEFSNCEIGRIDIITKYKEMSVDDVCISLITDEAEVVASINEVTLQLPNSPLYTTITLSIATKGGLSWTR